MEYIYVVLVGAAVGFLAGWLVKGSGFGWLINLIIGIVGAVIGYWLFCSLGVCIGPSIFSTLVTAALGAVLLLFFINMFGR